MKIKKKKEPIFLLQKWEKETWFFRSESDFLFPNEGVYKGGLANIGATQNSEFRSAIFGAILCPSTTLDELHVLNLGVAGVRSDDDVGARQDHFFGDLLRFDPGRDEEEVTDEPGGVGGRRGGRGGGGFCGGDMVSWAPAS